MEQAREHQRQLAERNAEFERCAADLRELVARRTSELQLSEEKYRESWTAHRMPSCTSTTTR